jgi:ribosomal protein S18 acetylase RimI-like enzyme
MLRNATLKDIPKLLHLEWQLFSKERFNRKQFKYAITNQTCYFRVYENAIDDHIEGYVYVLQTGRIYSIACLPNRGIGKILLNRAEEFVKTILNKDTIKLEVKKGNNKAINFYIKHGYKPYGIKHNYYNDGRDAILMKKELVNDAKG